MIRKFRAWWRRIKEHWRQKRELLLAADEALRQLGVPNLTFEAIELHCLQIGVTHLQTLVYARSLLGQQLTEAGLGEGADRPVVH